MATFDQWLGGLPDEEAALAELGRRVEELIEVLQAPDVPNGRKLDDDDD